MAETEKKSEGKIVMVFGTFDGLHAGHRFFLRETRKYGDNLIVVVAQNTVVKELKGKLPRKPLQERLADLTMEDLANKIVTSDKHINSWNILKKYKSDIICLGYDQTALAESLKAWVRKSKLPVAIITIPPYHPSKYHSSLLP